jgi:hypothetical protein
MLKKPKKSLIINWGYNLTESILAQIPNGLVEPFVCNKTKCMKPRAKRTKGKRKCKTKNRFNVALSTEKPPQSQLTI